MPTRLGRFVLAAVLAATVGASASAQPKRPETVEQLLQMHHIEKTSSVSFVGEHGTAISADEFLKQVGQNKLVGMSKKEEPSGDPAVTFKLMQATSKAKPGDAFPEFHLKQLDGSAIDNEALKGKYTLVNFYFAECPPCIKEVPLLNALAERRKDINLLAVTYDPVEVSKKFVADHHLVWPVVPDARKLVSDAGVKGFPTLALLDPQGKVVEFVFSGVVINAGGIESWLDRKMSEVKRQLVAKS